MIGIEPALKPAVHAGGHPRVLVMATPMTLREEKFHALMQRFESDAEILRLPCPGLVEYVEQGVLEGAELEAFLANLFEPYQSHPVDCVVLGCTHYPMLKALIGGVIGHNVLLVSSAEEMAKEVRETLSMRGELAHEGNIAKHEFFTSAPNLDEFQSFGSRVFSEPIERPTHIDLSRL